MRITGTTRVFMILGDPVAQVRAPEVYNHLFTRHGVDAVVVPMKVPADALAGFVRQTMKAHNVGGFWITIPHKGAMVTLVDRCDPLAAVAGAVNAVRRNDDGSTDGALFDGVGFVKGLDHFGIAIDGRRVLVLGAGGGGHAVAAALLQRGAACVAVHNRTPQRASELVARLLTAAPGRAEVAPTAAPEGFDLVVNCTSQGLKPGDALPVDVARIAPGTAVVDIIMSREPTPLLQACAARGIAAHPGFEMLVQQVPEFLRFFGLPQLAQTLQDDLSEVRALLAPR
jgi:shikimate dehydrogenase